MLRINPFKAIRPADGREEEIASVPYDVVNRAEAAELAKGFPYSFLRIVRAEIELPDDVDPYDDRVYDAAKTSFKRMLDDKAFIKEDDKRLYLYRQSIGDASQIGLVACCHVDDYENNLIKKHEKTRQAKEDDRTRHVMTLNANTGPVFLTYRNQTSIDTLTETTVKNVKPVYDFTAPDGVRHTVWIVEDTSSYIDAFAQVPAAYVADGHHRSASAWRSGKQQKSENPNHTGNEEYNWFLTVLFPDNQLRILPYNRVVCDLNGLSTDDFLAKLSEVGSVTQTDNPTPDSAWSFCFYLGKDSGWYKLVLDPANIDAKDPISSLDVALMQDRVLAPVLGIGDPRTDNRIDFVGGIRGTGELEKRVDTDGFALGISMYPTSIAQLLSVADADKIMPPKSTWFEPKLRSGLLVHSLDD